ncbi:hypothetical protein Stube_42700 [Streptomyces tubercidicus]|uniref:Uncharacterized protein n=1 Tax=Streptomyces tubercidicus TaxID=47759 RepID=A0A640UVL6_9ACTN|nr:hypothetical protein Stube_42700 [Streptomyces tubercidicus]
MGEGGGSGPPPLARGGELGEGPCGVPRRALPGYCRVLDGLCDAPERKTQKVRWVLQRAELWAESPVWAVAPYARTPAARAVVEGCRLRPRPRPSPYAQSCPCKVAMAASVVSAV